MLSVVALWSGGCSPGLDGPTPSVETPSAGAALPVDPGVVCRDQLTTEVTLHGEGLSPLPFDLPGAPKTALPRVELLLTHALDGTPVATGDDGAPTTYTFGGRPEEPNADHLRWQSQQQMTLIVDQSLAVGGAPSGSATGGEGRARTDGGLLDEGLYDLRVTNANGRDATSETALAVVDKPRLSPLSPPLTCLSQGARSIHLSGQTLLTLDGAAPTVEVEGVAEPFPLETFDGCVDIAHPGVQAATCTEADWPLAQDAVPPGYPTVTLRNPATAACWSTDDVRLRVVPPPAFEAGHEAEPSLLCTAEAAREVVVRGEGLLTVDGVLPTATLGGQEVQVSAAGECEPLETQGLTVETCKTLTVQVPQAARTSPQAPELSVLNPAPAGCEAAIAGALVLVPPPSIADIQPPVLCDDDTPQTLHVTGSWFLVVDGTVPQVTVDGVALAPDAVTPSGCEDLSPAPPRLTVQACTALDIVVDPAAVDGDAATVAVENPAPAGCGDTYEVEVPLVDPPAILDASPALVCTEHGDQPIDLTGTGLLRIAGTPPTVTVAGVPATVVDATGCVAQTIGPVADVELCTGLTITAPQGSLPPGGPVPVAVTNPAPIACAGEADDVLLAPAPVAVAQAEPGSVCTASGAQTVTFTGAGFLRVDGQDPVVTLGGGALAVESWGGCEAVAIPGAPTADVQSCTSFTVTIPGGSLPEGDVTVVVDNPDGPEVASCDATVTGVFYSVPVPSVTAVTPADFCTDTGETLTIQGTSFTPASTVTLTDPTSPGAAPVTPDAVQLVDDTTLEATFGGGIAPGVYDVTVSNAVGCEDTLAAAVEIHPTPLVFFIDPPVAYSGVSIQATIYTTGLQEEAAAVELLGPNGEVEALTGASQPGLASPSPNRITAVIPQGLAAGAWDVRVTTTVGCVGVLTGGLTVADAPTVSVASVDPAFVWQGDPTPVTIKAADPLPPGLVGFQDTPRAYLNPNPSDTGALASALRAVLWADASTLTAVVPAGLTPGAYDLIVVNPDATVGLLTKAVTVVYDAPPVVTAVVPASFDANGPLPARVEGAGFSPQGVTVSMRCKQPTAGLSADLPVSVTAATATRIDAVFPADQVETGSTCIVTVTNADGTAFRYSAVSTKTPAQNLNAWQPAPPLVEARRALGLSAARPTASSRYVYAVGGDDGDKTHPMASVEAAAVDLFGTMTAWATQRNGLPAGRTFVATARIGRFVYALGGFDGADATDTVWRAQVLDPLATPEIVDLDVKLREDGASGLTEGVWIYRVAAVFPADDPSNPGGESLPGEPLVAQLPSVPGLELTLTWDALPGASGYRIYRTPTAGAGLGSLELVGSTDGQLATSWQDAGAPTDGAQRPLPAGSTGVWHDAGVTLTVPREGHAVAVAADPTVSNVYYLYALGGRTTGGALLDSYEIAKVSVTPPAGGKSTEGQTLEPFHAGSQPLGTARADLGAFVITDAEVASLAPGESWVFLGPGFDATGAPAGVIEAGVVGADGDLGGLMTPNKPVDADAGYGPGHANGFLFMFGGAGGSPSDNGVSARLCTGEGVGGCNPDALPQYKNWNSLGISMSVPRLFPGATQESAFFFIAGGDTGAGPTHSVDTTVQ